MLAPPPLSCCHNQHHQPALLTAAFPASSQGTENDGHQRVHPLMDTQRLMELRSGW